MVIVTAIEGKLGQTLAVFSVVDVVVSSFFLCVCMGAHARVHTETRGHGEHPALSLSKLFLLNKVSQ